MAHGRQNGRHVFWQALILRWQRQAAVAVGLGNLLIKQAATLDVSSFRGMKVPIKIKCLPCVSRQRLPPAERQSPSQALQMGSHRAASRMSWKAALWRKTGRARTTMSMSLIPGWPVKPQYLQRTRLRFEMEVYVTLCHPVSSSFRGLRCYVILPSKKCDMQGNPGSAPCTL